MLLQSASVSIKISIVTIYTPDTILKVCATTRYLSVNVLDMKNQPIHQYVKYGLWMIAGLWIVSDAILVHNSPVMVLPYTIVLVVLWFGSKLPALFMFHASFGAPRQLVQVLRWGMVICAGIMIIMLLKSKLESIVTGEISPNSGFHLFEFVLSAGAFHSFLRGKVVKDTNTYLKRTLN